MENRLCHLQLFVLYVPYPVIVRFYWQKWGDMHAFLSLPFFVSNSDRHWGWHLHFSDFRLSSTIDDNKKKRSGFAASQVSKKKKKVGGFYPLSFWAGSGFLEKARIIGGSPSLSPPSFRNFETLFWFCRKSNTHKVVACLEFSTTRNEKDLYSSPNSLDPCKAFLIWPILG